ncbi:Probable phospholipid ABC transporter permease protein mlaE [Ralstonia pickettii]|nr:Probable phospholipid ABC transporter permease protein mlaE [Ralstonia pickettii]
MVTALLFAGRAGTSLTAEIGLMKAGEQLIAMEMMAVDPLARVLAPRFWAGLHRHAVAGRDFQCGGYFGRILRRGRTDWCGPRRVLVADAGRRRCHGRRAHGVIKSFVFGVAVTFIALYQGYEAKATPEGVSRATTRTVVIASLTVLALDFVLTALMFS